MVELPVFVLEDSTVYHGNIIDGEFIGTKSHLCNDSSYVIGNIVNTRVIYPYSNGAAVEGSGINGGTFNGNNLGSNSGEYTYT